MSKTRFQIAKKDITNYFEDNHTRIYTYDDISAILNNNKKFWRLPVSIQISAFTDLLVKNTKLQRCSFEFPARTIHRLTWGNVDVYDLVFSLEKEAYFSHYTALFMQGLTDQIPKKIYLTHEQPKKETKESNLLQSDINNAFSKAQRTSKNIARFKEYNICLLNGQFTDKLGVSEVETEKTNRFVTGLERTLIDITVRPVYSGGINEVLTAFSRASKIVSVNKLAAMLKKLNYVYPYHQAIGFYMRKTGMYTDQQLQLLKKFEYSYDFYLTHQMEDPDYSEEWKLYYPKGF